MCVWEAVFHLDTSHLFLQCLLAFIPLISRTCTEYWAGPPVFYLSLPSKGRVCSLVFSVGGMRSVSELCFWSAVRGKQDWERTGRVVTEYSSTEAIHLSVCQFSPIVQTHKINCGTAPGPTLTMGMSVIGPGIPLRHCFHPVTSSDPLRSGSRAAVFMHQGPLWKL